MLSFSNAKINLGLNIIKKRQDGFHNIESVFYPVPWVDILEVLPGKNFEFTTSGLNIPGNSDNNLIVKAYELLKKESLLPTNKNVKIHLHKVLPMGAGIGGGSSNGAFALKLINSVLTLNIPLQTLENLAETLGSDCPFFIQNTPKFCSGKGNVFEEVSLDLKGKCIVMVNPGIHVSTQEAYSGINPKKPEISVKQIVQLPMKSWKDILQNDFEISIVKKYPEIMKIKTSLYENGAIYASMTGSGSTVYGIWDNPVDLKYLFSKYMYWSGNL